MRAPVFPAPGDYNPYFETYLSLAKGKEYVPLINEQVKQIQNLFEKKGEAWAQKAYEAGKWSPKEVLGHITDTERVMAYRALCVARGEQTSLPGFDQDLYVQHARFNDLEAKDLLSDFKIHRIAWLSLLRTIPEDCMSQKGMANGHVITPSALFWIIPGHFEHHFQILKERY
ncbi:DinB family protein [Algoriphagus namhaensis]